jgi:uncharacterized membrane protein SpoIIM required for sporulation
VGPLAATTYKLIKPATPFIDGTALWHIIVISLAFGAGLALVFGVALFGFQRGEQSKSAGERAGGFLLTGVCVVLCAIAVGVGVYVMCNPPKTKPDKVVPVALAVGQRSLADGLT